jgi:hypothetical protein
MKKTKSIGVTHKITFGKKKSQKTGKKSYGPKSQKPKRYRGQGR